MNVGSARRLLVPAFLAALLATDCASVSSAPVPEFAWKDVAGETSDLALSALCRDAWELRMQEDPVGATSLGDPRHHGKLSDNSPAGDMRHAAAIRTFLRRSESIRPDGLTDQDRVTYRLLVEGWKSDLEEHDSGIDVSSWSLDARGGPQVDFLTLTQDQPIGTPE